MSGPRRSTCAAASVRLLRFSFIRMLLTWLPAVLVLMKRRCAISALVRPSDRSSRTSSSLLVRRPTPLGPTLPRSPNDRSRASARSA